jgi:NADH:ubiquinone oxidoreductase subunit 6 (subunit J)
MKKNVGTWDRIIRIIVGLLFVYLGNATTGALSVIFYIVAVILLLTGLVGTCPLYSMLKKSTKKDSASDQMPPAGN